MLEVVPARPNHVGTLAWRMREIDRLEAEAMGSSPKDALRSGLIGSLCSWTVLIDGRPEAMFGVSPISLAEGKGRPWLLMTDAGARQHRALMRLGARYTEVFHRLFPVLENYVHAHNATSIRWLTRLGYAVGAVDVIGGQPMRHFYRKGSVSSVVPSPRS